MPTKDKKDELDALKYNTLGEKITYWLLFPGEWVCNYFKVKEHNERALIRMSVNLAIYAKIVGTATLLYVQYS